MGTTPPPDLAAGPPTTPSRLFSKAGAPLTPEQVRKLETARLKAKALRQQKEQETATSSATLPRGTKRTFDSVASSISTAATGSPSKPGNSGEPHTKNLRNAKDAPARPLDTIQAARKFQKYVEYDLSKMNDTKGGFISVSDDPSSLLAAAEAAGKPTNMTLEDWERQQLKNKLQKEKQGAFEPAITKAGKKCYECGSLELDWKFLEIFGSRVCGKCKDKLPDKYSLLTKTECREDYLLTDPELRDEELLPHMDKPNPHKSNWATMNLYLRYQVEDFAWKKWGSPEALDAEYERRTEEQKRRKEMKFQKRLLDLKKRTRVETWKRTGRFENANKAKHVHDWGDLVEKEGEEGMGIKTCAECGMEVEEMII
ncbi:hypothetical protein H072_1936 [Dactylellina haptotyla CBS 200.50]|uniref:DNA repair protein RAD14 n=1 Tax=Dactylellina haptotyla (strain CBS 200.50) TaxID=1284197 RepID=S8AMD5_DACHA|nr:hypothetical protein H072_1936 [Dactylellina haptotyla CBS 200.50]